MNTPVVSGGTFLQPTFKRAAILWWAWLWRSLLLGIGGSFFLSLVLGIGGVLTGTDEKTRIVIIGLAAALNVPLGIWAFQMVLEKSFREFRIRLVPNAPSASGQEPKSELSQDR